MYSKEEIRSKSWLVREVVNLVLYDFNLSVNKIYLVGSYASGRATDYSDIDLLVELKGGDRPLTLPSWNQMQEIKRKLDNKRIHVIYGTQEAQKSLQQKDPVKFAMKEIEDVNSHSRSISC